jgi:hypothetical protein
MAPYLGDHHYLNGSSLGAGGTKPMAIPDVQGVHVHRRYAKRWVHQSVVVMHDMVITHDRRQGHHTYGLMQTVYPSPMHGYTASQLCMQAKSILMVAFLDQLDCHFASGAYCLLQVLHVHHSICWGPQLGSHPLQGSYCQQLHYQVSDLRKHPSCRLTAWP